VPLRVRLVQARHPLHGTLKPSDGLSTYAGRRRAVMEISFPDTDAEIGPAPTFLRARNPEPELDRPGNIKSTME
jgi:hypothetical protein